MSLSRRDFLKLGGLTAATLSATSCGLAGRRLAESQMPASLGIPTPVADGRSDADTADPLWRLLNRAGYGPRPGDHESAAVLGLETYLESQLNPDAIGDTAVDLLVANLDHYNKDASQLAGLDEREMARDLILATVFRAVYSRRQLYQAMVEFWSDHFHIYLRKSRRIAALKLLDDRNVIRRHALGSFRELLFASAHSPAMLVYLDNQRNVKGAPNENYARELMELHTLGVHGGYTQDDVQEVARAFTGWGVNRRGEFQFDDGRHDNGRKIVLGQVIPVGGGIDDGLQVLEILAGHPSTADFVAAKLVRRFVADEPPPTLVEQVAATFRATGGDVKAMLRQIFLSDTFAAAPPKLKRPYTFVVSALRATGADVANPLALQRWLGLLGQIPFHWPAPDGYPDVADDWANNLLPRWNFALALAGDRLGGVSAPLAELLAAGDVTTAVGALDLFAGLTLGRPLDAEARALFADYVGDGRLAGRQTRQRLRDAVGLMLASPAFQWT